MSHHFHTDPGKARVRVAGHPTPPCPEPGGVWGAARPVCALESEHRGKATTIPPWTRTQTQP